MLRRLFSASASVAGLLAAAACVLASNGVGFAQTIDENLWVTNGPVYAVVRDGGTIYIGGDFSTVGPTTGGGAARHNVAALDAVTGAATAWNANADSIVLTLVVSGSTVYAGGDFTRIGGQDRNHIAALDAATGAATAWNPNSSAEVRRLAVSGSTVYAAGSFGIIGGQMRPWLAALDATTGAATAWNPSPNWWVDDLVVSGSTVYVGGYFTDIGGKMRNHIAALDSVTGLATPWDPNANFEVFALARNGSTVYAGGYFWNIGSQPRNGIAALDATTGEATAWNPNADYTVWALAVSGSTVYAGGGFFSIGGQERKGIAALDAATGAATAWNPNPSGEVEAVAVSGSIVYVAGLFDTIAGVPQGHIAAFGPDAPTPTLLSLVSARAVPDRVELNWYAPARDVASAAVYRHAADADWENLGDIWADDTGRLIYEDARVTAGARYAYRLGYRDRVGESFTEEVWVDVPTAFHLALAGFRPNPAFGRPVVAFTLADDSPAAIEVLDLAGRRVLRGDVGRLGAGSHVIALDARLAPGTYVMRLHQAGRTLSARGVVVR